APQTHPDGGLISGPVGPPKRTKTLRRRTEPTEPHHRPSARAQASAHRGARGGRPPKKTKGPARRTKTDRATADPAGASASERTPGRTGGRPPEKTKGPARRTKSAEQGPSQVELWGFEPQTSSMPWRRATNCAIAPGVPGGSPA